MGLWLGIVARARNVRGSLISFVIAMAVTVHPGAGISVAGTYIVSPSGDDGNPGTVDQPWRTIAKANATIRAGDTVLVRAGTYSEVISPSRTGFEDRPIVYAAFGDGPAVLLGESAQKRGVVALGWDLETSSQGEPTSYIIVDGFHITYQFALLLRDAPVFTNRFAYVQISHRQSVHNTIRNCVITQSGDALQNFIEGYRQVGICITDAQYTVMENNEITGMWLGIWLTGAAPRFNWIRRNYIHDVGSSMVDIGDPEDGTDILQGNLIEDNTFVNSVNEDGIQFEPNYKSDYSQATNRGTIIRNNVVRGCVENAFDLKGAADIVIEGNIVYGNEGDDDGSVGGHDRSGGMGGVIHGGAGVPGVSSATHDVIVRNNVFYDNYGAVEAGDGYKVYNNTFINNNRDYTGSNSPWRSNPGPGFTAVLVYSGRNIALKNNIIGEHAQGQISINPWGMTNADIDYNMYSNADPVYFCDAGGALFTQYDLSGWQQRLAARGMSGAEEHSFIGAPDFINVPRLPTQDNLAYDFRLAQSSPARDAGGPLTVTASAGSGLAIPVEDAGYFCDGYGNPEAADSIVIESSRPVKITAIDHDNNVIRVELPMSWNAGARVHRPYRGNAPDIGALESLSASGLVPRIPTLVSPIADAPDVALPVTLIWNRSDAASSYHVQVATSDLFGGATIFERVAVIGDTTVEVSGLSAGKTYSWRVRSANGVVFSLWSESRSFVTESTSPSEPVLVAPPDKSPNESVNNVLIWQRALLDSIYLVQVSRNESFIGALVLNDSAVTESRRAVTGLISSTEYFWRVRARNVAGFGAFSIIWRFVTADEPSAPQPVSTGSDPQPVQTTLRWRPVRSAISYHVQVGTTKEVEGHVVFDRPLISRDTSVTVGGLLAGKTYYWRIRVTAAGGLSPWSGSAEFKTAVAEPNDYYLEENYPNPFNAATTLRFSLPTPVPVLVQVYNILGQRVRTISVGVLTRGIHEISLDLAGFPTGMYLYTLIAGDYRQTRKLLYVK